MMVYEGRELIVFLFSIYGIVLLAGIVSLPFIPLRFKPITGIITVFLVAVITSFLAIRGFADGDLEFILNGGAFFGKIPLRIDSISSWFILIINLTSLTGVLYGAGYLKSSAVQSSYIALHWILYIVFQTSMILVCVVQHSIAFIVVWEIMSLSSFLLVLFNYTNPKVLKAGINYLVQMHISVAILTVAFIWVYFKTGTFDFSGIGDFFAANRNMWLFLLFFAGFGLKAGFLGLHTWLPLAHPAAPSHISGVMSGVIVKMGIYGIFRIIGFMKADFMVVGEIVLSISILTGLFGVMNAAVHRDFKKMLAYCTIENIGIIGIGIGLGLIGIAKEQSLLIFLGFSGALLHVLNHSLFKSLLFFSAGSVFSQTHTRDMDKLGGLIRKMPKTAMLFLIGSIAIGGIPPLNGFISEFLIYCGILQGINSSGIDQITLMILSFAGMSMIGGISILAFTKTFGTVFLGTPRQTLKHEPAEVSSLMLLPMYFIVALMFLISFFPGTLIRITGIITGDLSSVGINYSLPDLNAYLRVMRSISLSSAVFLLISAIVMFFRWLLTRKTNALYSSTWGCGYTAPNVRMQYTGKSFSKSFGKLMNFILIEKKGYNEIKSDDIFPEPRRYNSFYLDFFEIRIIDPVLRMISGFINLFKFIQNGKIQAYVIYGIIFILVIFIGTFLNFWG